MGAVKLERDPRTLSPCPYCMTILRVPRRYNAVRFCPKAKRMAVGLPQNAQRFTLIDGHGLTVAPVKMLQRPKTGFFGRIAQAFRSARAAWKATR